MATLFLHLMGYRYGLVHHICEKLAGVILHRGKGSSFFMTLFQFLWLVQSNYSVISMLFSDSPFLFHSRSLFFEILILLDLTSCLVIALSKGDHDHNQATYHSNYNLMKLVILKYFYSDLSAPYIIHLAFLFFNAQFHVVTVTAKHSSLLAVPGLTDLDTAELRDGSIDGLLKLGMLLRN